MRKVILSLALLSLMSINTAQCYTPTKENLEKRREFQDAKLGIFIHWGIYSMLADGEWVLNNKNINYKKYADLAAGFYPSKFSAEEWVTIAKNAGAKYICITTRHHDGFSMFRTKYSPYNIIEATPFKRDIIKELAEECKKQGIKLHLYYSHLDWGREDYPIGNTGQNLGRPTNKEDWNSYYNFMNNQIKELLTNYGEIGAIWFDGVWDRSEKDWQLEEQYSLIHKIQPQCLIGNNHHKEIIAGEDFQLFEKDLPGKNTTGFATNQKVSQLPLESCETTNDTWGYDIKDNNYKSPEKLIQLLVRNAGMNANLLLNVGPQPNGRFPEESKRNLKAIGEWLEKYGESVYGTRGGTIPSHVWGVTTSKGDTLYVHILNLQDKNLFLPLTNNKVKSAQSMITGEKITYKQDNDGILLKLKEVPTETDHIIKLIIKKQ
ncbi:MAG: alpha-L-fucosidase [Bacteroidales bacterium]